jgi:peptidoglycan/xylan/chitin deacetylase (PgdA/CDA1 family)
MSGFLPQYSAKSGTKFSKHTETSTCLVLRYHRVSLLACDPLQLAVEPCNFERQMEYLSRNFNVIPISDIKQHLETATPFRKKTVAVTFDSGYADMFYTAGDVLNRYQIAAAVFIPSVNIVDGRQFWWDRLEELVLANRFFSRLEIEIDSRLCRWPLISQQDRFRAYEDLYTILFDRVSPDREAIMGQITTALGFQPAETDDHRVMNSQEVKRLEQGGLITIGGHTHDCVKLSSLPKWQQAEEISKNKEVLEEILGHGIEYFSYPCGGDSGYTAETMNILEDFGFGLAFGNSYGAISADEKVNCYDLPRVRVANCRPFAFYKFLSRFLD